MSAAKTLPCGRKIESPKKVPTSAQAAHAAKWRERLTEHLAEAGLKHSEQRFQIAEAVLKYAEDRGGAHFGVQDVVKQVQSRFPGIGVATVYRNIKVLCDAKILKETLIDAENQVVYEVFEEGHHDHIVCLDCGSIFEFESEQIEKLQEQVSKKLRFRESHHRHVIYAHCELLAGGSKK